MRANESNVKSLDALAVSMGMRTDELLPGLYNSLRRMARRHLRRERHDHSLNTTALVHEAWLKLAATYSDTEFPTERDFLALAGHLMRRVLTDHARRANRLKRGGEQVRLTYTDSIKAPGDKMESEELLALDSALNQLNEIDQRQVKVVEMRYFAGFSIEETAELMALSPATIKREWAMARAWLLNTLRTQT